MSHSKISPRSPPSTGDIEFVIPDLPEELQVGLPPIFGRQPRRITQANGVLLSCLNRDPVTGINPTRRRHLSFECCVEACCDTNDNCQNLTREICTRIGGVSQGFGEDCHDPLNPVVCRPQACCTETGDCFDLLQDICVVIGGSPQGPHSNCINTACPSCDCQYDVNPPRFVNQAMQLQVTFQRDEWRKEHIISAQTCCCSDAGTGCPQYWPDGIPFDPPIPNNNMDCIPPEWAFPPHTTNLHRETCTADVRPEWDISRILNQQPCDEGDALLFTGFIADGDGLTGQRGGSAGIDECFPLQEAGNPVCNDTLEGGCYLQTRIGELLLTLDTERDVIVRWRNFLSIQNPVPGWEVRIRLGSNYSTFEVPSPNPCASATIHSDETTTEFFSTFNGRIKSWTSTRTTQTVTVTPINCILCP